jgi:hypothetical protein
MSTTSYKGELSEIGLPDVFEFFRTSRKTGILTLRQDRIKKNLYIREGNIIFAASNLTEERLGDLLLAWGTITKEQYAKSVALLSSKKRQGRILVEIGAISPNQLWEGVQNQIRHIVYSLFNWDHGSFHFAEGDLPGRENITTDVSLFELTMDGIRRIRNTDAVLRRFPSRDVTFVMADPPNERLKLEPFERHILSLINGKRSLKEICRLSEIGDTETIKVLYMLLSIGYTRLKGSDVKDSTPEKTAFADEAAAIVENYNRMFAYLYRYMLHEVGPIAGHVLNKYLTELKETNTLLLKDVWLKKDGTLDVATILSNMKRVQETDRKELLISCLHEYLYAGMLAVKKMLGSEHESRVIESLKDIRPEK